MDKSLHNTLPPCGNHNNQWTFVTKLKSEHRIFRNQNGKLAIADNSGSNPSTTDDRELFIDFTRPARARRVGKYTEIAIPVYGPRCSEHSIVGAYLGDAMALDGLGIAVVVDSSLEADIQDWVDFLSVVNE